MNRILMAITAASASVVMAGAAVAAPQTTTTTTRTSVQKSSDPISEFNAATNYQNSGRTDLAAPLYKDLATKEDGTPIAAASDGSIIGNTLADESARRLDLITTNQPAGKVAMVRPEAQPQ